MLSVITGGGKWVEIKTHADPLYQHLIVTAERKFWRCVESGEPPTLFGVEPPQPRIEAVRIVDMSSSNAWAEFANVVVTGARTHSNVHLGRARERYSSRARERAANPAICLAAVKGAHRSGGRGEAREPHPNRCIQGARRHCLPRPAQAPATAGARGCHRYARQSWPVASLRRGARRCRRNGLSATWQLDGQKRRDRALGAEVIEHGRDFEEAKERALRLPAERNLEYAPTFHRNLVVGVATYAHELFTAIDHVDTVYVPVGLGSAICGMIGTRDVLARKTKVVGVVAAGANAFCRSLAAGRVVPTTSALTFADGMAVRMPDATALEVRAAPIVL